MNTLLFPITGGLAGATLLAACALAIAQPPVFGKGDAALRHAAADNKTTFLVFYREWDDAAQAMVRVVQGFTDKHPTKAITAAVNITEPGERVLVDRFQISRAPMPMVIAVHANGAVTGYFLRTCTEANLAPCLVTPTKAACMLALQQNRLVLLCTHQPGAPTLPQAVRDFQADPHFAPRTQVVTVSLADPQEATFFTELQLSTTTPTIVFMAPPGVLIGKYAVTASKDEMAKALAAAGKCCNDPNCKHNQK
ncbi:MAG: hypothetical protein NZ700_16415 [Gemmataceae bacterium]|nr:hypothetical protein [Gemmataceae bacterium]MDW8265224.1 hypothetical protein [Gemmataceae bacterium]